MSRYASSPALLFALGLGLSAGHAWGLPDARSEVDVDAPRPAFRPRLEASSAANGARPRPPSGLAGPDRAGAEPVADRPTRIEFSVRPGSVVIFLDGKRLGPASKVSAVDAKPGRRIVRLQNGEDQTELELDLERGKTLRFAYEFGD